MKTSTLVLLGLACLLAATLVAAADEGKTDAASSPEMKKAAAEPARKKFKEMSPEERKAERDAKRAERDARANMSPEERRAARDAQRAAGGFAGGKGPHHGMPHGMQHEFRGSAGMFMALVAPVKPVKVTFPLDEETRLKFAAARDGLMQHVRKQSKEYDVNKSDVKENLRSKTQGNQDETLKILVEAVKGGATVQEARMGIVIAQFEALDDETKKAALEKAKKRQEHMPEAARNKMSERLTNKNSQEKAALEALKTDKEKEEYVKKVYHPRQIMPSMLM